MHFLVTWRPGWPNDLDHKQVEMLRNTGATTCAVVTHQVHERQKEFSRGRWQNSKFFRVTNNQKDFSRGVKNGEIWFYPLETKKTTFFVENLMGKCYISKSRGTKALPCLPSDAHDKVPDRYPRQNCSIPPSYSKHTKLLQISVGLLDCLIESTKMHQLKESSILIRSISKFKLKTAFGQFRLVNLSKVWDDLLFLKPFLTVNTTKREFPGETQSCFTPPPTTF